MAGFNFNHKPKDVTRVNTKYRKIVTKIPTPESVEILREAYSLESRSMHGQMPIVWDKAKDFQVFDAQGNCWIDFTSTIFVANAGHGNPRVVKAVKDALAKPLLVSLIRISPPSLCEITTLLLASTLATMFVNPCALIEFAITSASLAAPVATNDNDTCASIAACPTLLSAIV